MIDKRSAAYSYKLSSNAAQLLLQFDERIREFSGVESSSNAHEYLAYKTPQRPSPIVYCDRRNSGLVVRLRKPFRKITDTVDPKGLCERGNAFPAFYKGPLSISHVMIVCDSTKRIGYIIKVIQRVFSLKPKPHRPRADQIERSLSAEQLARITLNLDRVYECATELLDSVRKLQVELGKISQDDGENDVD